MTKIEELEKQVAEMKATIELMKAEETKPKKFEFKYDRTCYVLGTHATSMINRFEYNSAFLESSAFDGSLRISKEQAEKSLARNKRTNRIEALAEQLRGLKEWEYGEGNYYICRSGDSTIWEIDVTSETFYPESFYMTKECAKEICRMLNNGEFEL